MSGQLKSVLDPPPRPRDGVGKACVAVLGLFWPSLPILGPFWEGVPPLVLRAQWPADVRLHSQNWYLRVPPPGEHQPRVSGLGQINSSSHSENGVMTCLLLLERGEEERCSNIWSFLQRGGGGGGKLPVLCSNSNPFPSIGKQLFLRETGWGGVVFRKIPGKRLL